jgi:N-carbamoylputrescine amidase
MRMHGHGEVARGRCRFDRQHSLSDQFARAMLLEGAEILFYPTAIGSEPYDLSLDTHGQWQRVMQGHAAANAVPVVAANRIGVEDNDGVTQSFYGHSFIADHTGTIVAELDDKRDGVAVASFDLDAIARYRAEWGFFRDRRTDLYAKSLL